MKFENEPTDEQLNELLRDIDVPHDLKSSLKQIPFGENVIDAEVGLSDAQSRSLKSSSQTPVRPAAWIGLMLAASLIGVGLFIASQYLPNADEGGSPIAKTPSAENDRTGKSDPKKISPIFTDMGELVNLEIENKKIKDLEAEIHAIKLARMETQLLELERNSSVHINQHEVESVIAAMSEQYSVPLGMPEAKVKSRMANVIEQFPGTRGADMAKSYLEQIQNN